MPPLLHLGPTRAPRSPAHRHHERVQRTGRAFPPTPACGCGRPQGPAGWDHSVAVTSAARGAGQAGEVAKQRAGDPGRPASTFPRGLLYTDPASSPPPRLRSGETAHLPGRCGRYGRHARDRRRLGLARTRQRTPAAPPLGSQQRRSASGGEESGRRKEVAGAER